MFLAGILGVCGLGPAPPGAALGGPGAAWPRAYEGERWEGPGRAGKKRGERGNLRHPPLHPLFSPRPTALGGATDTLSFSGEREPRTAGYGLSEDRFVIKFCTVRAVHLKRGTSEFYFE